MQQYLQNKEGLVENVFNKVYDKYDLMNDCMSFGAHRMWKKNLISWMNPVSNKILVDVACGTGDIGKLFLDSTNKDNKIFCVDPNNRMIEKGKTKLINYKKNMQEDSRLIKDNISKSSEKLQHFILPIFKTLNYGRTSYTSR